MGQGTWTGQVCRVASRRRVAPRRIPPPPEEEEEEEEEEEQRRTVLGRLRKKCQQWSKHIVLFGVVLLVQKRMFSGKKYQHLQ